jgi:hypothetical protein
MRRGLGRGRRGGGLLGTAARTAVIAGTATAVSGRVAASQQAQPPPVRQPAAESAPAAATAPISVDELHAQLTKLADLRQAGLLNEEEFATQKARLLAP